jgi:transcriptional regulator with XRE-family HTH domain
MTPNELKDFRARMGWDQSELGRRLGLSPSRIRDYERGTTRGKNARPAPIPRVVELAIRYLGGERAPLSAEERAALWRDVSHLPKRSKPLPDAALRREAFYDPPPER